MNDTRSEKPKVRVFKADTSLQKKVGTGTIDNEKLREAEAILLENSNIYEFEPLASEQLNRLAYAIKMGRNDLKYDSLREAITEPVMEIKGNAALFQYDLVGNLAGIMLSFLEGTQNIDSDVMDIIDAHHKTLKAIISRQMRGTGGSYGRQLEEELRSVCLRYLKRRKAKIEAATS